MKVSPRGLRFARTARSPYAASMTSLPFRSIGLLLFLVWTLGLDSAGAVPPSVEQAFAAKYPDAKATGSWELDSHGRWEIKFTLKGEKYRADFFPSGSWRETERNLKYKELPKAVRRAIERDHGDEKINEIEEVDSAKYGAFYDVEFKRPGKNHDIMYREDGSVIPE